jgi:hypothetical protein
MFISHNPKRHVVSTKLAKIMETKGNKILSNTKIKWIFMCSLVKGLLVKYHTFLMKMTWNALTITSVKLDLSSFIDVETSFD